MTRQEQAALIAAINKLDLDSGNVAKFSGEWFVGIGQSVKDIPAPQINMPHWVEDGVGGVVVEGRR